MTTENRPASGRVQERPGRVRRVVSWGVVAAVATFVWGAWTQTSLRHDACRQSWYPTWAEAVCADSDHQVSATEAQRFAVDYLDEFVDGDGPDGAWEMLTATYGDAVGRSYFNRRAKSVMWAETVGQAQPAAGFNQFSVVWRYYIKADTPGGQHINEQRYRVTLQRSDDGVVMSGARNLGKATATRYLTFPRVTLMRPVDTRELPRGSSTPTLHTDPSGVSGDIRVGGRLSALCNLRVTARSGTAGPDDLGWWTRTPQGWLPAKVLAEDPSLPLTDEKVSGIPDCDAGALAR